MNADYIIVGQGIAGTWLSYYLLKAGKKIIVIDKENPTSPSRISAGIINPVTGRRHVEVWMANEILPFAWNAYTELGKELTTPAITQKNIIDFFPTAQMRLSFLQRVEVKSEYLLSFTVDHHFREYFNYDFGYGEVRPVYMAYLEHILPAWRKYITGQSLLLEENFDINQLNLQDGIVSYNNITASKIIFCDGMASAENPYFKKLPFAPNKGEALIIEIQNMPPRKIFKKGVVLVPMADPGFWWVGSNYQWEFENALPTKEFRDNTETQLKSWLKRQFVIVDHFAAVRPATLERRPFVGIHPHCSEIGILNGLGTKGCSLAPFFAKQFSDHLLSGLPITPEADIKRFSKILSDCKPG